MEKVNGCTLKSHCDGTRSSFYFVLELKVEEFRRKSRHEMLSNIHERR